MLEVPCPRIKVLISLAKLIFLVKRVMGIQV